VSKNGEKYIAQIWIDRTKHFIGTFKTKEEAGVAYDRFVIDKSTEEVTYALNYPNMSEEERRKVMSTQKKHGTPNATTGLIGVYKIGEKYRAQIKIDGTSRYLGTFKTKEQAGVAYDRFVVGKSTEEVIYALNYPNNTGQQQQQQEYSSSSSSSSSSSASSSSFSFSNTNTKKRKRDENISNINQDDYNANELQLLYQLNEDHADIFSGNRQYEGRLTVWVYYIQDRNWYECVLMEYINKGNGNMGIQVKWIEADTTSEYTSEEMELAIRFDEPTTEERQMHPALRRKAKMSGNRKKQKIVFETTSLFIENEVDEEEEEMSFKLSKKEKKKKRKKKKKDKRDKRDKRDKKKKGKKKGKKRDDNITKRKRDQDAAERTSKKSKSNKKMMGTETNEREMK